jgi:hypothetical protein
VIIHSDGASGNGASAAQSRAALAAATGGS